jgi:hypothetical protein
LDSAGGDDRAASAAPQLAWPGADIRGLNAARRWVASFLQPDGGLPQDASGSPTKT